MIRIDKETRGRFGNKVFHYLNLMQLAKFADIPASCCKWQGDHYFENLCGYIDIGGKNVEELHFDELFDLDNEQLRAKLRNGVAHSVHSYSLHGPFWRVTFEDPRNFLKIKDEYIPSMAEEKRIGIHIRGGDTRGADGMNGREIHPPEYYINVINFIEESVKEEKVYYLCTDDPSHDYPSYIETLRHLLKLGVKLVHEPSKPYISDFATLSECDILISGSSTFVLAAALIGKENKKIIHSKQFVKQFKNNHQKWYSSFKAGMFFYDMYSMKSPYYNVELF